MVWVKVLPASLWFLATIGYIVQAVTPDLDVQVRGSSTVAPTTLTVVIRVRPDERNRALAVTLRDGTFVVAESGVSLNGAEEPVGHTFTWKDIGCGSYRLTVEVWRRDADPLQAHVQVPVLCEELVP